MRYTKTVTIHNELEFKSVQIGQWFKWNNGAKGQYLGQTTAGIYVCAYSHSKFTKAHAKRVKLQRDFAKRYGAK
jgi:peptide methionine sulfoxide reductase MsrB